MYFIFAAYSEFHQYFNRITLTGVGLLMNAKTDLSALFRKVTRSRFAAYFHILALYLILSFVLRIVLLVWSARFIDFTLHNIARALFTGFLYDSVVGLCFLWLYAFYLLLVPKKWIGSFSDKLITYIYFSLLFVIIYFSLLAEIPFWEEFGVRFNFIAVDYLIYTFEVISNINESYPLPFIITALLLLVVFSFVLLKKTGALKSTFSDSRPIRFRLVYALPILICSFALLAVARNMLADFSNNRTVNEIGKNGVFSFFTAFRSNELDYDTFYPELDSTEAYSVLKKNLLQVNQTYSTDSLDAIARITKGNEETHPNIILVTIESFSAEFLSAFGNKDHLTPVYDSLSDSSIFFTNLYATGTRTVRGMEALTLSVPPTPGSSIVRRPDNDNLFSVNTILRQKNYQSYFIYGGDGYFDNMNNFFGGQGFDIVDRNRGSLLSEKINTHRYEIPKSEISFENAWGICDEDLFRQSLKYADRTSEDNRPFFQFIMTTSNHKPYTFPSGKIDRPQGDRSGAVRYTDYALGKFIAAARRKPWFRNTVFVIVADHCASSAGKWEININKHHIPAIIYNLHRNPEKMNRLISQIDLLPTVFGYLGWNYNTEFYGKDINQTKPGDERAFIGNYRTLGVLKDNVFTQVDDKKRVRQFRVNDSGKSLSEMKVRNEAFVKETISYYQTASERFKSGKMKAAVPATMINSLSRAITPTLNSLPDSSALLSTPEN